MRLDLRAIEPFTRRFTPRSFLRVLPTPHSGTPLGMGYGKTRFASADDRFKLLYLGEDLATCIAEAIIRDRFEGATQRVMTREELSGWAVCEVSALMPLTVLDLRGDACFRLNISTNIACGKAQEEARVLSSAVYENTTLDGILYKSRLRKTQDCIAVYDRAVEARLKASAAVPLETLAALVPALKTLGLILI
ncbi:RES family NAD+ phosphorylase [Acidisoma sp. 7E03]